MNSFKKVIQFIEGNLKMLGDEFNLLPDYQKEQVLYRLEICKNDCVKSGSCKYCGCSVPGKLYVSESCNNGARFPNMMDENEWSEYKEENNIKIENN
jgi:hypothetical protein